jgi:hypothetical protein
MEQCCALYVPERRDGQIRFGVYVAFMLPLPASALFTYVPTQRYYAAIQKLNICVLNSGMAEEWKKCAHNKDRKKSKEKNIFLIIFSRMSKKSG